MKRATIILFFAFTVFTILASCDKGSSNASANAPGTGGNNDTTTPSSTTMKIKIGSRTFAATLNNNATANAFKALLPLTLNMTELNGNEKYADLSSGLPVNASNPGTIQNGDIMLYGSRTLVLFYKSFSTSYSYTKVGKVTDATGFAEALGTGNVTVTFEP